MKDIKFRFFDMKTLSMYPPISLIEISKKMDLSHYLIPMQSIGLKDIKGIDIYESDIVRYGSNLLYIVQYFHSGFKLKRTWNDSHPIQTSGYYFWRNLEIIGNVYTNPELLTPTTKK